MARSMRRGLAVVGGQHHELIVYAGHNAEVRAAACAHVVAARGYGDFVVGCLAGGCLCVHLAAVDFVGFSWVGVGSGFGFLL